MVIRQAKQQSSGEWYILTTVYHSLGTHSVTSVNFKSYGEALRVIQARQKTDQQQGGARV